MSCVEYSVRCTEQGWCVVRVNSGRSFLGLGCWICKAEYPDDVRVFDQPAAAAAALATQLLREIAE